MSKERSDDDDVATRNGRNISGGSSGGDNQLVGNSSSHRPSQYQETGFSSTEPNDVGPGHSPTTERQADDHATHAVPHWPALDREDATPVSRDDAAWSRGVGKTKAQSDVRYPRLEELRADSLVVARDLSVSPNDIRWLLTVQTQATQRKAPENGREDDAEARDGTRDSRKGLEGLKGAGPQVLEPDISGNILDTSAMQGDKVAPVDLTMGQTHTPFVNPGDESGGSGRRPPRDRGALSCCLCFPLRYLVVVFVFLGMVIVNAMRTNVGVTVLTILDKENLKVDNGTGQNRELPSVDWNTFQIGIMHSVFYVGYMITNLPGAYLTTKLPSHKLFGICILISCLLNLTMPVAIELAGYEFTLIVRLVQGLSEGLLYPSCYGILRFWSTPPERGRLGSFVFTGAYMGPVVGFPLAGVITDYLGWPYIYYFFGGIGVLYVMVWLWIAQEKPSHHRMITEDELRFIEELQGSDKLDYEGVPIPWCSIMTSLPVLALCLCHFARNWVFILMLTNEPFYLNLFHFTIAQNGAFSALPHLFKMAASLASGCIADFLISNNKMSVTRTRKLLTSGFGLQALFFGLLTVTTKGSVAMVFLTIALASGGMVVSGWQLNHYDLSPRHASVLVGITSTVGNIAAIGAPIIAGILTENKAFLGWWRVFYITCGVTGFACIFFLIFGSGERQSWSVPSDRENLVVREDKRRRKSLRTEEGNASHSSTVSMTYRRLEEEQVSEADHVIASPMPGYGSQDVTLREGNGPFSSPPGPSHGS